MTKSTICSENREIEQFNYDLLDSDTRKFVETQVIEIKQIYARTLRDAWEAGRLLLEVKEKIEYGQFCQWITLELGLSRSTACNQMHLAQNFTCATVAQLALPITACYELARASTPSSARDEVMARSKAGEKFTKVKTRQIIARHKSKIIAEATRQQSPSELNPSEATIEVGFTEVTDCFPDNVVHFRSKNHTQSKPCSGTFHAICLFTSLNSLSLQIMKFAKDGRKSC